MALSPGGIELIANCAVFTFVCTLFVGLRLYARKLQRGPLRSHDYWICLALVFTWGLAVDQVIAVPLGATGEHHNEATTQEVTIALKSYVAASYLWLFATVCIKVSITLLYMDIFSVQQAFKKCAKAMLALLAAFFVSFLLLLTLGCIPFKKYYELTFPGHCTSATDTEVATAVVNMIVDTLLILMPMPSLWGLKMPVRKKVYTSLCFSIGAVVIAINTVRIYVSVSDNKADFTYSLTNLALFASLEVWIGVIAACLPTLRPIVARFSKSLGVSPDKSRDEAYNTGPKYGSAMVRCLTKHNSSMGADNFGADDLHELASGAESITIGIGRSEIAHECMDMVIYDDDMGR